LLSYLDQYYLIVSETRMNDDWLAKLASRHNAQLRSYLSRFTSSKADIDDWMQEALLRVFAASKVNRLDDPPAYLFRTARNVALKRLGHRRVKQLAASRVEQMTVSRLQSRPMHQALQQDKDLGELFQALAELPKRCREVFILCKLDGCKYSEAAERMGISINTVEKHMVKALRHCRDALSPTPIEADSPVEPQVQPSHARYRS
jgi:RNA polymerase sigma-70 factor (ECF subfamily)